MHQNRTGWNSLRIFAASAIATLLAVAPLMGFTTTIDNAAGVEDNAYANGRIINSANDATLADWSLSTTVNGTDFANDALTGGPDGLQYVMLNTTMDSRAVNSVRYDVTPAAGYSVESLIIQQSPYDDNGTWNGGNSDIAQFVVSWSGGGVAMVNDPDNQIFAFQTGTPIISGTTVRFDEVQTFNSEDSWSLELPAGVNSVQVNWSSANPSPNSDLTREWVSFDVNVSQVPEPAALALFGIGGMLLFAGRRRYQSA